MVNIEHFVFNPFQETTYLIWDTDTREAAIVDPGMSTPQEEKRLDTAIMDKNLSIKAILLTHAHDDHTFGVEYAKSQYHAPVLLHKADDFLGKQRAEQAKRFHLPIELGPLVADRFIGRQQNLCPACAGTFSWQSSVLYTGCEVAHIGRRTFPRQHWPH